MTSRARRTRAHSPPDRLGIFDQCGSRTYRGGPSKRTLKRRISLRQIPAPASVVNQSRAPNYDILLCSAFLIGQSSSSRRHFPRGAAFVLTNSGNTFLLSNHNGGSRPPIELRGCESQRERSQSCVRKQSSVLNSLLFMYRYWPEQEEAAAAVNVSKNVHIRCRTGLKVSSGPGPNGPVDVSRGPRAPPRAAVKTSWRWIEWQRDSACFCTEEMWSLYVFVETESCVKYTNPARNSLHWLSLCLRLVKKLEKLKLVAGLMSTLLRW